MSVKSVSVAMHSNVPSGLRICMSLEVGKNRFYKRLRNAYKAFITGCTLDPYLKQCNHDTSHVPLSITMYTAKLRSDRYYKATHAATLDQSKIDPFLKQRDGSD